MKLTGPDAVPPPLRPSNDERMRERLTPAPEPPLKMTSLLPVPVEDRVHRVVDGEDETVVDPQAVAQIFAALGLDVVDIHFAECLDALDLEPLGWYELACPGRSRLASSLSGLALVDEPDLVGERAPIRQRADGEATNIPFDSRAIRLEPDTGEDRRTAPAALGRPTDDPFGDHVQTRSRRRALSNVTHSPRPGRGSGDRPRPRQGRRVETLGNRHLETPRFRSPSCSTNAAELFPVRAGSDDNPARWSMVSALRSCRWTSGNTRRLPPTPNLARTPLTVIASIVRERFVPSYWPTNPSDCSQPASAASATSRRVISSATVMLRLGAS